MIKEYSENIRSRDEKESEKVIPLRREGRMLNVFS